MSKGLRYLSGILALASTFMLCSCRPGEKTTKTTTKKDATTSTRTTTSKQTTQKQTTSKKTTTKKTTTRRTTTQATTTQQTQNGKVINFYCFNDEFHTIIEKYYKDNGKEVKQLSAVTDLLPDGTKIEWKHFPNLTNEFNEAVEEGLENGDVDMFEYEPELKSYDYINGSLSEYVASLSDLDLDLSKQFDYIKKIGTNFKNNKVYGTSWFATPGVIAYNSNVSDAVFGSSIATYEYMKDSFSTKDKFESLAEDMALLDTTYSAFTGPGDAYRGYLANIKTNMYDASSRTITIDDEFFNYASDMYTYDGLDYLAGTSSNQGYWLWGEKWVDADKANSKVLAKFTTTWYNKYIFPGDCEPVYDNGVLVPSSQPWRLVPGYFDCYWNGTMLSVTNVGISDDVKKESITKILSKITTDKDTLRAISDQEDLFTNSIDAMGEKAEDTSIRNEFFGGQNIFAVYKEATEKIKVPYICYMYNDIIECFQSSFMAYIEQRENSTAEKCWTYFVQALKSKNSELIVEHSSNITLDTHIRFK